MLAMARRDYLIVELQLGCLKAVIYTKLLNPHHEEDRQGTECPVVLLFENPYEFLHHHSDSQYNGLINYSHISRQLARGIGK